MRYWFAGTGQNYPTISLSEVTNRSVEAKNAVEALSKPNLFDDIALRGLLVDELKKTATTAIGGEFDYISSEIALAGSGWHDNEWEKSKMHWVAEKVIGYYGYSAEVSEFAGAFGESVIRLVAKGNVKVTNGVSRIAVTEVGIYFRDKYDFIGGQFLGYWSKLDPYVGSADLGWTSMAIGNSNFRALDPNGANNFRIFSNLKTIKYPTPYVFDYQLPVSDFKVFCPRDAIEERTPSAGVCTSIVYYLGGGYKDVTSESIWSKKLYDNALSSVNGGILNTGDVSSTAYASVTATYGEWVKTVEVKVKETLPPPSNLYTTMNGQTATIRWNTVPHATEYRYVISQYADFRDFDEKTRICAATCVTNTTQGTSYTHTASKANWTYYVKVRAGAGNTATASEWSKGNFTTPAAVIKLPSAPSSLRASVVSKSKITLTWNDNSNNENGFFVYQRKSGGSWQNIGSVVANIMSASVTGLTASTKYEYKIAAYNSAGENNSGTASATTPSK